MKLKTLKPAIRKLVSGPKTITTADQRMRGRALQARRLKVWTRDPLCQVCRRLCDFPHGFELDHRIPLFKGGADDESNLDVLCHACHATKTAADLGHAPKAEIGLDGWPVER